MVCETNMTCFIHQNDRHTNLVKLKLKDQYHYFLENSFIFLILFPLERFRNPGEIFFSYKGLVCNELNNIFYLE